MPLAAAAAFRACGFFLDLKKDFQHENVDTDRSIVDKQILFSLFFFFF
ncbi:hypothetical protein KJE20_14218, partial [Pyrenophora tritici-repentis]